ncbi:DENN domain-containing protein 1A [Frankliniella fusca]|uniref:DENN domain-containing protein 1A n=1 Tax=Frankliniella fusca TaxID=407009 RepID=A0AAE1LIS3_9NEOP|nr:DENN domain-containing protein 1A [Frankliniella fusca]
MGSRIRENVKHLFQCFCEVVQPQPPDKDPWIIQKFPEMYNDEEILKSVPKFAYPCEFKNTVIQHYSFVLTSIDSKWTFGFCRHDPKTETALVLLSFLPWHETFYKLLDIIGEMVVSSKSGAEQLWTFLDAVYNSNVPEQGGRLQVPYNHGLSNFTCQAPNQLLLPSIPENRNLMEYYSAVDSTNMMIIFASMLYERRIVFTSTRLSRLSACAQAANAIIYPMNWQHIFIPVLPLPLIDYLLAPMPFLIGVPTSTFKKVRRADMGEVVVLDADSNTVESPFNDLESLPVDVVNSLKRELRNQVSLGDGVSRAFLRALVQLIGGYRDALRFHQGERITFNADAFVESRPPSMQPFLRKMLQLQIFQQFIEERLDMLNAGLGFSDEFELEACNYSDKTSRKLKQQYKEWLSTVRKEGSAFLKSVRNKANPAMKSAVKSVKDRGKDVRTAYKDFRSKLRELQPPSREYPENAHKDLPMPRERSNSAPSTPPQRKRPATLSPFIKLSPTASVSYRKDPTLTGRKSSIQEHRSNYSTLSPGEASCGSASPPECGTPGLKLSPIDTDLMGDLHEVIFQKCSSLTGDPKGEHVLPPVDRTLKPVRSFENFGIRVQGIAGSSAHAFQPLSPVSGAACITQAPLARSGAQVFSLITSFHTPFDPQLESQLPLAYSTPKAENNVFTPSPDDVFTSFAQIPSGRRSAVPSSSSSIPSMPLTAPPTRPSRAVKASQNPTDLIRLDSTPSFEDFDPLSSANASSSSQYIYGGPANINSSNNNVLHKVKEPSISNPLYPYFAPQGNTSFLYPTDTILTHGRNTMSLPPQPGCSSNINQQSRFESQDSELLKEYGLDFKSLSLQNGGRALSPNGSILKPVVTDPFEEVERLVKDTQQQQLNANQSMWTKFE